MRAVTRLAKQNERRKKRLGCPSSKRRKIRAAIHQTKVAKIIILPICKKTNFSLFRLTQLLFFSITTAVIKIKNLHI